MNRTELMVKAMTWKYPETIPVSVGILPAMWKKYPEETRAMVSRYTQFFGDLGERYDYETSLSERFRVGKHIDEWGCVWSNIEEGMNSIVTEHPVKTREDIRRLEIPKLRDGKLPHGFMYLRYLDLRGFEEAMLDFAEEPPELQTLLDKILEHNLIQTDIAIKNNFLT